MKKFLASGIAVLVLAACASNDLSASVKSGEFNSPTIAARFEQVEYSLPQDGKLKIEIAEINESRCPGNVVCIQAGNVSVTFNVSVLSEPVKLYLPVKDNESDNYEFVHSGATYKLVLKNVTPYPTTNNRDEKKSTEFVLEKI